MTTATFGSFYSAGIKRTIRFLRSRGIPSELVEDVAQSAWLRGWTKLEQLRDDAMIIPWINTIALNEYRRLVRHTHREQPWNAGYLDRATSFINCAAVEVTQIVERCPPKTRVLLQAQLLGATPQELADEAGISCTAMRIRLYRARRKALEQSFETAPPRRRLVAA